MKNICIILFSALTSGIFACSGITRSFCETHAKEKHGHVFRGILQGKAQNSVQLIILDVLKGVETRTSVVIWSGKDFDCNGPVSMQVGDLGQNGDTILIMLHQVTTANATNAWEVPGDYKRPNSLFSTPWLPVNKGVVTGFISGSMYVEKMPYDSFRNYWTAHGNDCSELVGIAERPSGENYRFRNTADLLSVENAEGRQFTLTVLSMAGQTLVHTGLSERHDLAVHELPQGIYVVQACTAAGEQVRWKILRN